MLSFRKRSQQRRVWSVLHGQADGVAFTVRRMGTGLELPRYLSPTEFGGNIHKKGQQDLAHTRMALIDGEYMRISCFQAEQMANFPQNF